MKLHHFGFLTNNMQDCIKQHLLLSYEKYEKYVDDVRLINIQFLKQRNGNILLEIVEPLNEKSIAFSLLKKYNNNLYHSCYEVDDLQSSIKHLCDNSFILIDQPKPAIAFNNRDVCFLMSKNTSIIELLQK